MNREQIYKALEKGELVQLSNEEIADFARGGNYDNEPDLR